MYQSISYAYFHIESTASFLPKDIWPQINDVIAVIDIHLIFKGM